jgi:16S rRNA A1518/A1519 N6-dimethyltransferase RsmA/KsgA/DIM1 with predicted DNA glycosylase/AP lyase activity
MTPRLTAVEVRAALAEALATRMSGTNVEVVDADATHMPFPDDRFSAAVSFII